jgi:hypothetical protein
MRNWQRRGFKNGLKWQYSNGQGRALVVTGVKVVSVAKCSKQLKTGSDGQAIWQEGLLLGGRFRSWRSCCVGGGPRAGAGAEGERERER